MADKAFIKGISLLTALAQSPTPRALSGLAEQLGLTKSNTHRLLSTLVEQGFVIQEGNKGPYRPTLRLWELGSQIIGRLDFVSVAREYMPRLAASTGETVHLSVLQGAEVVYLDKTEGTHIVRSYTQIGERAPAWCVATGKILIAYAQPDAVRSLIPKLRAFTPRTLTDHAKLRRELEVARAEGIAYNRGEWREDVMGSATAIFDAGGSPVAAVGISGPSLRLRDGLLEKQSRSVIEIGRSISRALGYAGDP
ncbi:MAG: IclR family transcriptional regulator [Hyphomicrobiaceae bacterium]